MDLGLSGEQEALVGSFAQLLAKASSVERVRAVEPGGFDPELWRVLLDTGAVQMGVPETAGGWGASLLDLVLVAEQVGRAMAPAPVLEAQVAARLLAAAGAPVDPDDPRIVTFAVRPLRGSVAELLPAGAMADAAVVLDHDRLLLAPVASPRAVANLAGLPLADVDVDVDRATVLAEGAAARAAFEAALDEWLVLTAAAVVGMGSGALAIACAYASERRAFGSLIGSFQGIAYPLADDATSLDGARLLARKAAWSLDRGRPRGRELSAMAFAFAGESAEKATYDALHAHGGYGFMLEYDVQLLYRRVRGWARVWGDPAAALARAAAARYPGEAA